MNKISIKHINIILFGFFLLWNFCQPLIIDDLFRSVANSLPNHKLLQTLFSEYHNLTGRMSAQILVHLFFNKELDFISIPMLNILNAIFLLILYNLVFKIVINNRLAYKTVANYLLYIFIFTVFISNFDIQFLQNSIWKTVALQYLWGVVLLVWIYQKYYFAVKNNSSDIKINVILYFLLGSSIGLYNELFWCTVIVVYIFSIVYAFYIDASYKKAVFSYNIVVFMIGNLIGGIILIIAPGNYVRLRGANRDITFSMYEKITNFYHSFTGYRFFIILIIIALIIPIIKYCCSPNSRNIKIMLLTWCFLGALIGMYLPIGNIGIAERMIMLLAIIVFIILGNYLYSTSIINKILSYKHIIITLCIINFIAFSIISVVYLALWNYTHNREQIIIENIQQGNLNPIVEKYNLYSIGIFRKLVYFNDIESDPNNSKNVGFARYYNLNSVKTK